MLELNISYSTKKILINLAVVVGISILGYIDFRWPFYKLFPDLWWSRWAWMASFLVLVSLLASALGGLGRWLQGQGAEEKIWSILNKLPRNFFHKGSVVLGKRGDIDEVVVGPTGIWTIEVKSHAGKITFDGKELRRNGELFKKDFLRQALAEKYAVHDFLGDKFRRNLLVQPVIVFSSPHAEILFGLGPINGGVYVVSSNYLRELIQNTMVQSLDDQTIEAVSKVLETYKQ